MTKKKERTRRGREIRKATGLSLPVSMYLGRHGMEARYTENGASKTAEAAQEALVALPYCECCGPEGYEAVGPKGSTPIYYW